jgi:hypothetical protein
LCRGWRQDSVPAGGALPRDGEDYYAFFAFRRGGEAIYWIAASKGAPLGSRGCRKPYVDNGVSSTGPMLITASRKTQSPSSAGKKSPPYSPWWLRNASISAGT